MFEARAYISDSHQIKNQLMAMHALAKGSYAFRDDIYQSLDKTFDLNQEFMRVRVYDKGYESQKPIELSHKVRVTEKETSLTVFKKQFNTLEETQPFLTHFQLIFSFNRTGKAYQLGHLHIFIEDIEGLSPSIKVLSPSQEQINQLFNKIAILEMITDSIPQLVQDQMKSKQPSP